jgi:predicted aldo/keto reductase-like oxidoreductase
VKKIKIAVNLPSTLINTYLDFDRYLNAQLSWLQTDRIDFCLLGGLNRETWPRLQALNVLRWAERSLADGRIGKLGFSFHDDFQVLRGILEAYDNWALCKFQYSYMDVDHHPGIGGLKYASEKGLAVVISEPLRGGQLTRKPPESVASIWASTPIRRTLAEWGLLWVWNHPEVATVVGNLNTLEQLVENVALADKAEPDSLTVPEQVSIAQVRAAYRKLKPIPCTSCWACMPCLEGIDVPRIFELYNDAFIYGDTEMSRSLYQIEQHRIDNCNECGVCMKTCGRTIGIPGQLKAAQQLLTGNSQTGTRNELGKNYKL